MTTLARAPETVEATYLGYRLVIGDYTLRVFSPDGLVIASGPITVASARRKIRRHRYRQRHGHNPQEV